MADPRRRAALRALVLMIPPIASAALGVLVMTRHGVGASRLALQLGAVAAGVILAIVIATRGRDPIERRAGWMAGLGLALMAATFVSAGLDGVHRWVGLGPVRLHASAIASPLILTAAAALVARGRPALGMGPLLAAQAIHLAQPDAGQATALAAGAVVIVAYGAPSAVAVAIGSLVAVGSAAAAWLRLDPLPAVPTVEGIVRLAGESGAVVQGAAVLALASGPVALAMAARRAPATDRFARAGATALAACAAATVLVPLAGNYPVPVMGFGVSPVLGVAICAGVVAALRGEAGSPAGARRTPE